MTLVSRQPDLIIFDDVLLHNCIANILNLTLVPGNLVEVRLWNETRVTWNVASCFSGSNVHLVKLDAQFSGVAGELGSRVVAVVAK